MSDTTPPRVDPRALLRAVARRPWFSQRDLLRVACIGVASLAGLAAFGAVVVRANDDQGVLAFVRQQIRPAQTAGAQRTLPTGQALSYAAPRSFFDAAWGAPRRAAAPAERRAPQPRIVASYAPYAYPIYGGAAPTERPLRTRSAYVPVTLRTPAQVQRWERDAGAARLTRGGRVAYCVRTCDGFFFPLGPGNGSDAADAAACQNLCPSAETRVYTSRIGDGMEDARAQRDGRRYSALQTAFSYRKRYDAACSCNGGEPGLATSFPVSRDRTLRVGDVVMTRGGMKVFDGGAFPYREASFTSIGRSSRIDQGTREALRRIEMASLPGRSGIARQALKAEARSITVLAPQPTLREARLGFRTLEVQPTRAR